MTPTLVQNITTNGVKRAKEAKEEAKARKKVEQEEHRAAMALAALEIPKSMGVGWNRKNCKWEVQFMSNGKNRHLGYFDFDDHTKAVAEYKRHESMATAELEALFNRQ